MEKWDLGYKTSGLAQLEARNLKFENAGGNWQAPAGPAIKKT